jgi:hypothetical protein
VLTLNEIPETELAGIENEAGATRLELEEAKVTVVAVEEGGSTRTTPAKLLPPITEVWSKVMTKVVAGLVDAITKQPSELQPTTLLSKVKQNVELYPSLNVFE